MHSQPPLSRSLRLLGAVVPLVIGACASTTTASSPDPGVVLVVHGGAGTIRRGDMTAETEAEYRAKLEEGLLAGFKILRRGGSSLEAVEATIRIYEDSPLFNAGKGAVFTAEGKNELDASIMDGATLQAGAVAAVTTVRHPISAARAVMQETKHVLLTGSGAESFAALAGLEIVEPEFFYTQRRWDSLQRQKERQSGGSDAASLDRDTDVTHKMGTVGALALDKNGNLAAGTSTGGTTNKRYGRVGDSPIIGAGTYATAQCAVSATGTGEHFIRHAVAHDICARAEYLDITVGTAAQHVIHQVLEKDIGGVITLDRQGKVAMPFNTEGMYRGYILADDRPVISIYKD